MGGTCAICVSDFEAGEMLKRLPCRHVFHSECIDPWLLGVARPMRKSTMHATCPLCKRDAIDLADIV
ncbi:hypothetical protein DFJ73DRAFT_850983 [Zopfochytrium polystomum]|nr:hypothetical protein DFJ73DRAFT_850983 [Zopfochytrium polystomum]